ncbi:uncharacterized protein LOC127095655 [Lathyrus oleraceus]|uniref:uncharacterized protein LOC127095655 n=1 Tax=Pisum sativum TaxID=3888 RepID=UPI0021D2FA81|nr:uncharacterized protein LOC127095655 [Pisum sativum]
MPPKLKDPGSFSIPYVIGKFVIDKELCDLGASVSLMPLSIGERLNLGNLKPTKMCLQLVNRSIKYPVGILENVPVRIGQLYVPTNFVVMNMKKDSSIPILLGRPFLATAGAIIDVKRGKLTFEVGEKNIEFIISKFMKGPTIDDTCCVIDIIDECVKELEMETPQVTKVLKIPTSLIFEDNEWSEPYEDDSLRECLSLIPDHMPDPKQPTI